MITRTIEQWLTFAAALAATAASIQFPLLLVGTALAVLNLIHLRHSDRKDEALHKEFAKSLEDGTHLIEQRITRIEQQLAARGFK